MISRYSPSARAQRIASTIGLPMSCGNTSRIGLPTGSTGHSARYSAVASSMTSADPRNSATRCVIRLPRVQCRGRVPGPALSSLALGSDRCMSRIDGLAMLTAQRRACITSALQP